MRILALDDSIPALSLAAKASICRGDMVVVDAQSNIAADISGGRVQELDGSEGKHRSVESKLPRQSGLEEVQLY